MTLTARSSTWMTITCASVVPMSFWITSRPPERVAVVARPGWANFSFAVRLSPVMKARTSGRSASAQAVDGGAVQRLLGHRRLQTVESLVQVHHQPMQAVCIVMPRLHHRRDSVGIEQVVCRRGHRRQQRSTRAANLSG